MNDNGVKSVEQVEQAMPLFMKYPYLSPLEDNVYYAGDTTNRLKGVIIGTGGYAVNPGSDTDVDIFKVVVTGDPKCSWDESEDRFVFNKALEVTSLVIRTAQNVIYYDETDQVDPAGRWRHYFDGDVMYLQHALTAAWATSQTIISTVWGSGSPKTMIAGAAGGPAPDSALHVWGGSAGTWDAPTGSLVTIEDAVTALYATGTGNDGISGLVMGDPANASQAYIKYYHPTHATLANVLEVQISGGVRLRYTGGTGSFAFQEATTISSTDAVILDATNYLMLFTATGGTGKIAYLQCTNAASGAGNVSDSPTLSFYANYRDGANALVGFPYTIFNDMTAGGATPASSAIHSINSVEVMRLTNTNGTVSMTSAGALTVSSGDLTVAGIGQIHHSGSGFFLAGYASAAYEFRSWYTAAAGGTAFFWRTKDAAGVADITRLEMKGMAAQGAAGITSYEPMIIPTVLVGGSTRYGAAQLEVSRAAAACRNTIYTWDSADTGSLLDFLKSGSSTPGVYTAITTGHTITSIYFEGADGTDMQPAGYLAAKATGTIGNNRVPGLLEFHLYSDAATSVDTTVLSLTAAGAILGDALDIEIGAAGSIKSGATNGDTMLLKANDTTFITFTTGATDTCDIASDVTIGSAYIYRAGGTDVAVADGGTGLSSYAIGDILYASAATTIASLADVAVGSVLISGGVGVAPAWSTDIATGVTIGTAYIYRVGGTDVAVTDGGTGLSAIAAFGIYYASALNTVAVLDPNTAASNKFLRMIGTGSAGQAPSWEALVAGDIPDISTTYLSLAAGGILSANITMNDGGSNTNSYAINFEANNGGTIQNGYIDIAYGAEPYMRLAVPTGAGVATPVINIKVGRWALIDEYCLSTNTSAGDWFKLQAYNTNDSAWKDAIQILNPSGAGETAKIGLFGVAAVVQQTGAAALSLSGTYADDYTAIQAAVNALRTALNAYGLTTIV